MLLVDFGDSTSTGPSLGLDRGVGVARNKGVRIVEIVVLEKSCKKAKLQARIKPTALCSAIDKENSIESLLDLLHYIYNYYHGYAPCLPQSSCLSADFFVTCCDHDL